jgi:hypothetical protein
MHFLLFLLIGVATAAPIYPILDQLFPEVGRVDPDRAVELLKCFFLLDHVRSLVAVVSCLVLILSLIAFHKSGILEWSS